jgi:hypothetical protein
MIPIFFIFHFFGIKVLQKFHKIANLVKSTLEKQDSPIYPNLFLLKNSYFLMGIFL